MVAVVAVAAVAVAVVVVAAVAAVVVAVVAGAGAEGAGQEVVLVVTIPHWIWSVSGHQLEQKSGRGYLQDSPETRKFSRD